MAFLFPLSKTRQLGFKLPKQLFSVFALPLLLKWVVAKYVSPSTLPFSHPNLLHPEIFGNLLVTSFA